jgi:hypothetical protein
MVPNISKHKLAETLLQVAMSFSGSGHALVSIGSFTWIRKSGFTIIFPTLWQVLLHCRSINNHNMYAAVCPIFRPSFRHSSPSQRESGQAVSNSMPQASADEPSTKSIDRSWQLSSWAHCGQIGGGAWQQKTTISKDWVGLLQKPTSLSYHGLLSLLSFSRFTFMNQYFLGVHHWQIIFLHPNSPLFGKTLGPSLFDCKTELCNLVALASRRLCPFCPKIIAMLPCLFPLKSPQTGGIPHFRTQPHGRKTCVLCVTLSLSLFLCDGTYVEAYVTSRHPHTFLTRAWPSWPWGIWGQPAVVRGFAFLQGFLRIVLVIEDLPPGWCWSNASFQPLNQAGVPVLQRYVQLK